MLVRKLLAKSYCVIFGFLVKICNSISILKIEMEAKIVLL